MNIGADSLAVAANLFHYSIKVNPMSDKQTLCPSCSSLYMVAVPQLTVAQGMVCCPKCGHQFNALLYLYDAEPLYSHQDDHPTPTPPHTFFKRTKLSQSKAPAAGLKILERCVDNSNLDLRRYLNNLNYFHHDALHIFPSLNLSKSREMANHRNRKPRFTYYITWGVINLSLLFLFAFQILWFNPKLLEHSETLSSLFTKACHWVHCETLDQRYHKIQVEHIQLDPTLENRTQISGVLMNYHTESLKLPKLKITIYKGDRFYTRTVSPSEYLIHSLEGNRRIPAGQTFAFKFTFAQPFKENWQYKIQIIRP